MKTYILKQNLPGGHLKGDKFNFKGLNLRTNKLLMFCPEDELDFFTIEEPMKYEIGTKIILNIKSLTKLSVCTESGGYKLGNIQVTPNKIYTVFGYKNKYYIIKTDSGHCFLRTEKEINETNEYWFVNSSGEYHKDFEGKNHKKDTYLKSIGNFHKTKQECVKYVENLQRYNVNKLILS